MRAAEFAVFIPDDPRRCSGWEIEYSTAVKSFHHEALSASSHTRFHTLSARWETKYEGSCTGPNQMGVQEQLEAVWGRAAEMAEAA